MKIFTLKNHGSLIKIQCMDDPQRYLKTALARTIDSHTGYVNAFDVATETHQEEINGMMQFLGIVYYVTRYNSNLWVKESWLKDVLGFTQTKMKRYAYVLENGIKYKGAGGYIKRKEENGETSYQINVTTFVDYNNDYNPQYNLKFLESNNQLQTAFATLIAAEHENKEYQYQDTGIKKNTTLNDIGEFSVHNVNKEFKDVLKNIDDTLFPIPVDASALNASKVKDKGAVIFENALAMF